MFDRPIVVSEEEKTIIVEKEKKITTIYDQGFWGKKLFSRKSKKF